MRYLNRNISKDAEAIVAQYMPLRDTPTGPMMLKRIEPLSAVPSGIFVAHSYHKQGSTLKSWIDQHAVMMQATEMAHKLFEQWKGAFSNLRRLAESKEIDTTVEYRVLFWLVQAYISKPDLACPELVYTGEDKGVDIEWNGDAFFLSLQIESLPDSHGLLYSETVAGFSTKELSPKTLRNALFAV